MHVLAGTQLTPITKMGISQLVEQAHRSNNNKEDVRQLSASYYCITYIYIYIYIYTCVTRSLQIVNTYAPARFIVLPFLLVQHGPLAVSFVQHSWKQ